MSRYPLLSIAPCVLFMQLPDFEHNAPSPFDKWRAFWNLMPWFCNQRKIYLFVFPVTFYLNDNYSEGWMEQFQRHFAVVHSFWILRCAWFVDNGSVMSCLWCNNLCHPFIYFGRHRSQYGHPAHCSLWKDTWHCLLDQFLQTGLHHDWNFGQHPISH